MAKVYVSSTFADLRKERTAVIEWLIGAGHQPVHSYVADSETVRESCLQDVDGCDLYVVICGQRYGHQPEQDNPEMLSITHLEFRRAARIPRIALLRTSVPDLRLTDLRDPVRSALVQRFEERSAGGGSCRGVRRRGGVDSCAEHRNPTRAGQTPRSRSARQS
jgi:hypothetical protein